MAFRRYALAGSRSDMVCRASSGDPVVLTGGHNIQTILSWLHPRGRQMASVRISPREFLANRKLLGFARPTPAGARAVERASSAKVTKPVMPRSVNAKIGIKPERPRSVEPKVGKPTPRRSVGPKIGTKPGARVG
jgi:hypothetical protein